MIKLLFYLHKIGGDKTENNFKCKKCGCDKVYAIPSGRRMGVYCAECNEWIAWTSYRKMREIYSAIDENSLNDKVAIRKIFKKRGITTMRCSKCDCLLYDSSTPKIQGQFDLVNAKFCPRCGRGLI